MRALQLALLCSAAYGAVAPDALVPVRWPWADVKSLELVDGTAVNCLLVEYGPAFGAFAVAGAAKGVSVLAVVKPEDAGKALADHAAGIVLEGEYSGKVRDTYPKALVVEITPRGAMKFTSSAPILATGQGVWPGVQALETGRAKAAPSGAAWIDTNIGFLQAARELAAGATIWIAVRPPEKQVLGAERYLQAVGDAAIAGSRWVVAFDSGFAKGLAGRETRAMRDWKRLTETLGWFEAHGEWRSYAPGGKLAIVQDEAHGALLSGGILDMISTKHTPVRPVSPSRLSLKMLEGANMAVNVEPDALTPAQQEILTTWRKAGGTLLTAPPGWKDAFPGDAKQITLDDKQLKRIDEMWKDVSNMIGRRNLGVRLFNVSSMLSTFRAMSGGKPAIVELVNYADYPIENVTVHLLGKYKKARLFTPDGKEKDLELYEVEEGTGMDLDSVGTTAVIKVE